MIKRSRLFIKYGLTAHKLNVLIYALARERIKKVPLLLRYFSIWRRRVHPLKSYLRAVKPVEIPKAFNNMNTAIMMKRILIIDGNGDGSGIKDTTQYTKPRIIIFAINVINI